MRIVIDVTEGKFLLVLNPSTRSHYVEGDATVSRTYSALTIGQLRRLYANTTSYALEARDYSAALQACKFLAIRILQPTGGYTYDLEKEAGEKAAAE